MSNGHVFSKVQNIVKVLLPTVCNKQISVLVDDEMLYKIPSDILALKLTIKGVKENVMLHDMFMPAKT